MEAFVWDSDRWQLLLDRGIACEDVKDRIARALRPEFGSRSDDIAFHASDWIAEAAGLVALHMNPDALTDEEVSDLIEALAIHAVHHVAALTHLTGNSVQDVWNLGVQVESVSE